MSENTKTINYWINDSSGKPQAVKVIQGTIKPSLSPLKFVKVPIAEIQNEIKTLKAVKVNNNTAAVTENIEDNFVKAEIKKEPKSIEIEAEVKQELHELDELNVLEVTDFSILLTKSTLDFLGSVSSNGDQNSNTMSYTTRKRPSTAEEPQQEYSTKRRRHADKVGKGLRHFSMKVCEKVRNKGFTSYNEVADELVSEFTAGLHGSADHQYDQKNIRRRVYDALNVLMAMNIISKEKKEIRWLGLPTNSVQECTTLEKEKQTKIERINKKTQQLEELLLQHISFKSLIERNKEAENRGVKPSPSSAIHLPFIVVNTTDKALIDCSISNDKTEYMFNFNKKFQIHDDIDILKRMGLLHGLHKGECSEENIRRIKTMVPKALEHYVEMMGRGNSLSFSDVAEDDDDDDEGELEQDQDTLEDSFKVEMGNADDDMRDSSDESSDVDV